MSIKEVPYNTLAAPFNIEKVIIYPRKSREDIEREKETGEDSLALMTEILVNTCKRLNIPYSDDDIMPEIGSADTIDDRPVFSNIINNLLPSGKYQGIAVREISRLGRGNFADAGRIYDTIVKYKIFIVSPYKTYDPTNKMDLKMIRWELFQAREEYESTKDRLWYARDARARKGYAPNYIATLGIESVRGRYIIVPEEAELVIEIFEMRARNMSLHEIATVLNNRGLKTKKGTKYHSSTINKILNNRRYIGKQTWMGTEVDAQHPAIVPISLWNKVHDEINPARTRVVLRDNRYLVDLYCRECGKRMYGEMKKMYGYRNGHRKYYGEKIVYICVGKRDNPVCNHFIIGHFVHDAIFKELTKIVNDKSVQRKLVKNREKLFSLDIEGLVKKRDSLTKQLSQKQKFLSRLELDYSSGELSATLYSKHNTQTENEITSLTEEINKIKSQISNVQVPEPADDILSRAKDLIDRWDYLDNLSKKKLIKALLPKIEIDKNKEFYIVRNLPATLEV